MDWTYRITHWLWTGLDWLFPPVCGGCQQPGYNWCPDCQKQVTPVPEPLCPTCGLPQKKAGVCAACEQEPPPYTRMRSWVVFEGPIRPALHRLKYRRNMALGDALSRPMSQFAASLNWPVDTVVAVPLEKKRMQECGYNQVALVARPLAALNGWELPARSIGPGKGDPVPGGADGGGTAGEYVRRFPILVSLPGGTFSSWMMLPPPAPR